MRNILSHTLKKDNTAEKWSVVGLLIYADNQTASIVNEDLSLTLLVVLLANRKNSVPAGKCRKLVSGTDVVGEYMSTMPDDNEICEIEWDSPRPLSGNICYISI